MSDGPTPPAPTGPAADFSPDELLAEAERRARRLLGRTPHAVGATLVAGWPALLGAAAEVLDPHDTHRHLGEDYHPTRPDPVRGAAALVDRLSFEAVAVGGSEVATVTHPAVQMIIDSWQQAAAMLRRPPLEARSGATDGGAFNPTSVDVRVTRTLTVIAHVTQVSLRGTTPPRPLTPDEAERLLRMAQRHEQQAIQCLRDRTSPDTSTGTRHSPAPSETSSLDSSGHPRTATPANQLLASLKHWAPLAIAVAADPDSSMRDLRRIAHTEEITTTCAAALVTAAAKRGELPMESMDHLRQRLGTLSEHWQHVAEQYGWVRRYGSTTSNPLLWKTSKTLADTIIEATHNDVGADGRRGQATAATIAARFTGAGLVPVLQDVTQTSAILAELFQRTPTHTHRRDPSGQLRPAFGAPERLLRQISLEQHNSGGPTVDGSEALESPAILDVPVTANGVTVVPMTSQATAVLRVAGLNLARAANNAEQAVNLAAGTPARWRTSPVEGSPATRLTSRPLPPPPPPRIPPAPDAGMAR